jgi:hypothetical protein
VNELEVEMELVGFAVLLGTGATAVMDLWGIVRRRWFGIPAPNYAMVGRWLLHMPRGRFVHASIGAAAPVPGERAAGWAAHYLIGIAFAALLLAIWGVDWIQRPTLGPALVVGVGTVAAPFLLMQPGMGAGIAASRTPRPVAARLQSLVTHTIFGLGLFTAAQATRLLSA